MKVHVWMNFPSHHQSGFFDSLIAAGVDLQVTYYEQVSAERVAQGWNDQGALHAWEKSLAKLGVPAVQRLCELSDYIHIIPGYGSPVLLQLSAEASRQGIRWCHWSEASTNGLRWWARYLTKRSYARRVNRYAIGAFAQGAMARIDFMRWGIRADKIADLTYSVRADATLHAPDQRISEFAGARGVFLFVGRFVPTKAIAIQLKAFAELDTREWCLVLIGPGDQSKYRTLAQDLGITADVLFLPAMGWKDIGAAYSASDVLLLPSHYDGWGAVASEAANQARALILSTACGSAWHLVAPAINGFLVTPGSVASLREAMRHYVRGGRSLAAAHGQASSKIGSAYTCDASARRLIDALHSWTAPADQPIDANVATLRR